MIVYELRIQVLGPVGLTRPSRVVRNPRFVEGIEDVVVVRVYEWLPAGTESNFIAPRMIDDLCLFKLSITHFAPVSYTHLDVYKRQRRARMFSGGSPG